MPPVASPRALIRRQIVDLWGEGRTGVIPALYAPNVVDHMPAPGQPEGLGGLAEVVETFRAALPDLTLTVHAILQEGDRAVDVWTLEATHTGEVMGLKPRGARVRFSGIDMIRAEGGRIAELWHVEELPGSLSRPPATPPPLPAPPPRPHHGSPRGRRGWSATAPSRAATCSSCGARGASPSPHSSMRRTWSTTCPCPANARACPA